MLPLKSQLFQELFSVYLSLKSSHDCQCNFSFFKYLPDAINQPNAVNLILFKRGVCVYFLLIIAAVIHQKWEKNIITWAHIQTLGVDKRTFGTSKRWFRCQCCSGSVILCSPFKQSQIRIVCCILHNHALLNDAQDRELHHEKLSLTPIFQLVKCNS